MDVIEALKRGRWFAALDPALAEALVAAGRTRALDEGQWIYSEGDAEPGLCLVVDGVLRLEASAGLERGVLIGLVGPGQAIGQSRRFGGGRRIVTASAQRPAHVLLVPDAALPAIADRAPGVWAAVIALLYDQLDAAVHAAALNLGLNPRQRIAARLAQLADEEGVVPATQTDLAEMCGLSRKSASGHILALARREWVVPLYRSLLVTDRAALRAFAGI
ncbi:Crp/Fnr family transcriptional regulator [Sphingomonas sp.]|jgi:CRP-like cAMP-binding protein|uniref:Crp/Fnr family transcriptional regulator n=1 Tax=Sphingomonas sp. TaxID=28214 RepID=UPI002E37B92A|nr:Crp/Fnr family transcriptional regulator [Sphingomonas sp.]HEX4695171.1 Crp/Fnr family transcriptional regulator [Sphingomonas sp.]